ncbi:hypothetical protein BpHYR1_011798 [Brachionus plicatilis]|uniref:EF-hand domain-containing protein n=1 Tax=Brachionus plicatilis TaxID=10195 RepID=A0A3M7T8M3_BRAPC|nr:hypothetical protein BpHYR1_011798 [Brachionus plicatilis]
MLENNNFYNQSCQISKQNIRFCDSPKVPFSEVENAIVQSKNPIEINESEEIEALNLRGIWINREENLNWKGPIPLEKYELHQDPNPELMIKKPSDLLKYKQEVKIKYLHPPPIEKPGDIIIKQLADKQLPPAPPLVIRQDQPKPKTPPPIVIREEPPAPPPKIPSKVINLKGKTIPPPARKVVVERLPQTPQKPQDIYIERWLPYKPQKRKIIYKKADPIEIIPDPKNVVVDWEIPDVEISQEIKTVGVFKADPKKYLQKYGQEALIYKKLPKIAKSIPAPDGLTLAADQPQKPCPPIEGDVECLRLLDLDKVGLGDCKSCLSHAEQFSLSSASSDCSDPVLVQDLFRSIDYDNSGFVYVEDVEKVLCGLIGKKIRKKDLRKYLRSLDADKDKHLSFHEFKTAFLNTV